MATTEVTIRAVDETDIPLLREHLAEGGPAKHRERLHFQQAGLGVYLVAWQAGRPVGHALLKWAGSTDAAVASQLNEACPDVEDLFVVAELRGRGIGTRLLSEAERLAAEAGDRRIGLAAGEENGGARRLYERLGYQDSGFGAYEIGGEFVDAHGTPGSWTEVCHYLTKPLPSVTPAARHTATVRVDAGAWLGELPHNWNYIGYDEINYTYTPEGKELLAKFGQFQEKPYYVRAHHLFCTGNGHGFYKWGSTNVYVEDDAGRPRFDWTFVDLILDTLLQHGCKPFVELGFMPQDLADPVRYDATADTFRLQHYQAHGWACPPKDYDRWYDLVFRLVQRCVDRHGVNEIRTWYWELWNEPDLGYYWKGSVEEFCKLYDYTAAAVKAACPQARVGGPGTTNPALGSPAALFLDSFLDHCVNGVNAATGERGAVLDFLSFHVKGGGYRADPRHRRQAPPSVQRIVSHTRAGHAIIQRYPTLVGLECVLSEIDPDGWAAGGAWDNVNLNFRNIEYYPSFVAAAFHKVSQYARRQGWDLKLLTWAFLFVGERCFEGTRAFSTQGIDKAILNLFRLYARMGHQEVLLESSGAKDPLAYADPNGRDQGPDIDGFATLAGDGSLQVLIYNHHDDWDMAGEWQVELEVERLPFASGEVTVHHHRIDHAHSNAYAEWVRQGRPMYPPPGQAAAIKARAGVELLAPPPQVEVQDGRLRLAFSMPVHGVSLLVMSDARTS